MKAPAQICLAGVFMCSFLANSATAGCAPGHETLMHCTFQNGKQVLNVCMAGPKVSYAYGKIDLTPEILITQHVRDVTYAPWSGFGRSIWEAVTFTVDGHSYEVTSNFDRLETDPQKSLTGRVVVTRDSAQIAQLNCDAGSVEPAIDLLYDAKALAGQCYDHTTQQWRDVCE